MDAFQLLQSCLILPEEKLSNPRLQAARPSSRKAVAYDRMTRGGLVCCLAHYRAIAAELLADLGTSDINAAVCFKAIVQTESSAGYEAGPGRRTHSHGPPASRRHRNPTPPPYELRKRTPAMY